MLNGARAVKVRLLELVDAGRCGVREQNATLRQRYRYDTFISDPECMLLLIN